MGTLQTYLDAIEGSWKKDGSACACLSLTVLEPTAIIQMFNFETNVKTTLSRINIALVYQCLNKVISKLIMFYNIFVGFLNP